MKILIVEDEKKTGEYLTKGLTEAGFVVDLADNGLNGYHLAMTGDYDLLILDIMLPDVNGWDIVRMLRAAGKGMPILLLTALGTIEHRVKGLELGADDYLVKPFAFAELLARVRSQLRRYLQLGGGQVQASTLVIGGICLDDNAKTVTVDGDPVALTPKEYDILRFLMRNAGTVFSPNEIYRRVWEDVPLNAAGAIAVHIRHLREKLEINPSEPRYIKVVWGKGYKMEGGVS